MRYLLLPLLFISTLACAELPETDWLELMPPEDRQALEDMPEISHQGLEQDSGFYNPGGLKQQDKNLPAVMYSTNTVAALNGKALRPPLAATPYPWRLTAKVAARCSFWCRILAPVSTSRHRHRINWCWCATPKALNWKTSTHRCGSAAR